MRRLIVALLIGTPALASGPIYVHKQPAQEEFRNLYSEKADANKTPQIFTGTTAPSFAPSKVGDIFVNTTAAKVYVSTSTASSGGWIVVN